ncbi:MAG TPA: ATP cone domain-containing protein [Rhodothermales bacterium]|nr:ATP cone domain-containing protein [Rhodothermales bacterium]
MGIYVIDPNENTRVPFLRGILTRSLRSAGLSFNEAYRLANKVRDKLGSNAKISTDDLTELVIKYLDKGGYTEALERYQRPSQAIVPINVIDRQGQASPFSKGHLSQSLEICAFPKDECYSITADIEQQLVISGITEITSSDLARFTYRHLCEHAPPEIAQRYLVWVEFSRSGKPLILLIGGAPGVGKSTIGSEIAHRLNIVRTQSTDMLREVMRLMVPKRLLPALHVSSFSAWKTLPSRNARSVSFDTHFVDGYLTQAREVSVGIEGVLKRAEREQVSIIMEGVHIYPMLQKRLARKTDAIVIPLIVGVLKRKQLRKQLQGRGQQVTSRRSERYLESFDAIWELQSYLLTEADRHQITIVPNVDELESIRLVMETISEHLATVYEGTPEEVFA